MTEAFLKVLDLSIAAGWIIIAVILLRPVMRRSPKYIRCVLWGIVGLRLCLPFTFESRLSLVPQADAVSSRVTAITAVSQSGELPQALHTSASPAQVQNTDFSLLQTASAVWIAGIVILLLYAAVSSVKLRRSVIPFVKENGVYVSDGVEMPFILGVIKPRIYIPSNMGEAEKKHILAHERAHLARRDHLWKPLGFLILSVYWFNPLVWVGYILLSRDIELACDERVIKKLETEERANYSETLLNCSVSRKRIVACPLAFGEVGVKARIVNILKYKKPAFWIIAVSVIVCAVVSVCFLTARHVSAAECEHEYSYGVTTAATCTLKGTGTYTCKKCGDKYTEKIPLIEHEYIMSITANADCTTPEMQTFSCKACGNTYTGIGQTAPETHIPRSPEISVNATCIKDGEKTVSCEKCGKVLSTEKIPAAGHKYSEYTEYPSCTVNGYYYYICETCGDTYTGEVIYAGHSYVEYKVEPTRADDGYYYYTCSVCGDTYVGETIPATGFGRDDPVTNSFWDTFKPIELMPIIGNKSVSYDEPTGSNPFPVIIWDYASFIPGNSK